MNQVEENFSTQQPLPLPNEATQAAADIVRAFASWMRCYPYSHDLFYPQADVLLDLLRVRKPDVWACAGYVLKPEYRVAGWWSSLFYGQSKHHRAQPTRQPGTEAEALPQLLQAAATAVASAEQALADAQEAHQALVEVAQLQTMRREHARLYGPDPITGLTAAQEYRAFKQAQREQS